MVNYSNWMKASKVNNIEWKANAKNAHKQTWTMYVWRQLDEVIKYY